MLAAPLVEQASRRRDVLGAGWRRDGSLRFLQSQVVDESQSEPASNRSDLMFTIGIECGELRLKTALRTEVDRLIPALVADDKLPAFMSRRQRNDQRGDHAVQLFPVAMCQKETPRLIKQQLIEMGFELLMLQPQFVLRSADGLLHHVGPFRVRQRDLIRVDFPNSADIGVDQRLGSLAIRRLPGQFFERRCLSFLERQGDHSHARHL